MSLKGFLDAAYALLVEAWLRIQGVDLLTAVEKVNQSIGLGTTEGAPTVAPSPPENEAALRELQKMMGGMR